MPLLAEIRHDSLLGRWRMARWSPSARLSGYAVELWDMVSDGAYTRERIPPRTHFDLLINLGETHRLLRSDGADPIEYRGAWIAGRQQSFLDIQTPRSSRVIGAQLTAAGARGVVRAPLIEIGCQVVELDQVAGSAVESLRQRLLECAEASDRLGLLEGWLEDRIGEPPGEPPVVTRVAREIVSARGMCRIRDLAREANVSQKHLITLFERNLGVGPKPFAEVIRFNGVIGYLKRHPAAEWADVVYRFGYYDQAHFGREMRRFTGASPTEFRESRGPDGDTVVVAE